MSWRAVGLLFTLLLVSLFATYAFQRHQQERAFAAAKASFSSEPLFVGVERPKTLRLLAKGCVAVPASLHVYGPVTTVPQMDAGPLRHEPGWQVLRQRAMDGDVVRQYKTQILGWPAGGYVLLRGPCLLGQVNSWWSLAID